MSSNRSRVQNKYKDLISKIDLLERENKQLNNNISELKSQ